MNTGWHRGVPVLLLIMPICAFAQSTVQNELLGIIEAAKSDNEATRTKAVADIISLRSTLAKCIVSNVDSASDKDNIGSKASGVYLLGKLGYPEGFDTLVQNRNWEWNDPQINFRTHKVDFTGNIGESSWANAGFSTTSCYTLKAVAQEFALERLPSLRDALISLGKPDRTERGSAERTILEVDNTLRESFSSVLSPEYATLFSNDVKVTAAFLLGELRASHVRSLVENIGLHDDSGTLAKYPVTMSLGSSTSSYPCVDALIKTGRRADVTTANEVLFLQSKSSSGNVMITDDDKRRLVNALALCAPVETTREFTHWRGYFHDSPLEELKEWGGTEQSRNGKLTAIDNALATIQTVDRAAKQR